MATVERNGSIEIMKYNNITGVDISIRDTRDDEVLLLNSDVIFLHSVLSKWLKEDS